MINGHQKTRDKDTFNCQEIVDFQQTNAFPPNDLGSCICHRWPGGGGRGRGRQWRRLKARLSLLSEIEIVMIMYNDNNQDLHLNECVMGGRGEDGLEALNPVDSVQGGVGQDLVHHLIMMVMRVRQRIMGKGRSMMVMVHVHCPRRSSLGFRPASYHDVDDKLSLLMVMAVMLTTTTM